MDSMRFSPKHWRMVAIEMWILTLSSPGRCSPYQKRSRTVPEPRMPRECHSCTQWRRLSFCCSHLRLHEIYDMLIYVTYVTYVNHYHILQTYCILLSTLSTDPFWIVSLVLLSVPAVRFFGIVGPPFSFQNILCNSLSFCGCLGSSLKSWAGTTAVFRGHRVKFSTATRDEPRETSQLITRAAVLWGSP